MKGILPVIGLSVLGFVMANASLAVAYFFMQRYLLLEPCPLCILDRIAVFVIAIGFLCVFLGGHYKHLVVSWLGWWLTSFALLAGFIIGGRHLWLQYLPPQESGLCLSDSESAVLLLQWIADAFSAKADCGTILWEFLGLSIPEQTFLLFIFFAILQGVLLYYLRQMKIDDA